MKLSDFDYPLDPSLIAQHPHPQRDQSRLLVLHRKTAKIEHRRFDDLHEYLRPGDVLLINNTKVLMARLYARKEPTGGKAELLLVRPLSKDLWEVMVSGRNRVGGGLKFEDGSTGEIVSKSGDGRAQVKFDISMDFEKWLDKMGRVPLPPYIKRVWEGNGQEKADRTAYQTVYAAVSGSIAAPTAGLHFTPHLMDELTRMGVHIYPVTLHIGPGTFLPVRVSDVRRHILEAESMRISEQAASAIRQAKGAGRRIFAVGTTTVRALESAASGGEVRPVEGPTALFISPGHRFRAVDALITNFHLPRSTLLMLVSAFAGRERLLAVYEEAVRERYRFYSYGDAMLLL